MGNNTKRYLTRLAMPRTWKIKRKDRKWITRPIPGAHKLELGIPLCTVLRDFLSLARTTRETRNILYNQEILVDGKRRKDKKFTVGLMDVITIPKIKKNFRMLLDEKGKLTAKKITEKEAKIKLSKISSKKMLPKAKVQLNLDDGRNILVDKDIYKVGDTLVIEIPSQKINEILELKKGAKIFLIGGKHCGEVGEIQEIKDNKIVFKNGNETFETFKKYVFVVGKDKPVIEIK